MDHTIRMWCSQTWTCTRIFTLCVKTEKILAIAPHDAILSVGLSSGRLLLWNIDQSEVQIPVGPDAGPLR